MMCTTTSYHPTGFQTTSTSASYKEQQNVTKYGYEDGNFHYPTTPTAAATTIGYGGSTQNTRSPCQLTIVSNIQPNPPSPQFFSYPPYSSQRESRQPSSYGSVPIPDNRPRSLVVEPPTRVHSAATMTDNVKQVECYTSDAGTKKKKKSFWSMYGRSKDEVHVETEGSDGGSSNLNHEPAQRRWSLKGRSNRETELETTPAVNNSSNISCKNGDESNHNNSQKAQRRWIFYGHSKKEANNESKTDTHSSVNPANSTNDLPVVYQLPKDAGSNGQQQPGAWNYRPAEVHPEKHAMKQDRKAKMAGAATTGAIVGAVLTGPVWPVGAMAGAAIGSYAGKVTARAGERRQQRKWEQKTFNEYLAKGEAGVQREGVVLV